MYSCIVNISKERCSSSSKSVANHSRLFEHYLRQTKLYISPVCCRGGLRSWLTGYNNNNCQRIATQLSWSCFSFCSLPCFLFRYVLILASNLSNLKEPSQEKYWHNLLQFLKQTYGRTWPLCTEASVLWASSQASSECVSLNSLHVNSSWKQPFEPSIIQYNDFNGDLYSLTFSRPRLY